MVDNTQQTETQGTQTETEILFDVADFLTIFPEFADIKEETLQFMGDLAIEYLPISVWGEKWHKRAVYLLTAHNIAMRFPIDGITNEDGSKTEINDVHSTLQITSHSAGASSLSESGTAIYTNSESPFMANLSQTRYGLTLLALIETRMPCGYTVK